jgi:predicted dehydrogenase
MALKVGFVGLPRASSFVPAFRSQPDVEAYAGCDINPQVLKELGDRLGLAKQYVEYEAFLDSKPDAVVIATPMPHHAPQAAAALRRGIHVLSEVPAVVDLAQAWELVEASRASRAIYMMGENYCYLKTLGAIGEMVAQGLFGELYYAEGEYVHELKQLNEATPWRRIWQTGLDGITYGTHCLGPVLSWFKQRVVRVSGFGSGHHYCDPSAALYENEDTCMMLCQLDGGGLIRVRVDMLSNRPHLLSYYSLQGTRGCYEGARGCGDVDKVWLMDRCDDPDAWRPLADFIEEFTPQNWRTWEEEAQRAGHGGGDFLEVMAFLAAVREGVKPDIDIYTALDFSLPGLVSQESIARGGMPLPVPDFRAIERFPDDLPAELRDSWIMRLATPDGQPTWRPAS